MEENVEYTALINPLLKVIKLASDEIKHLWGTGIREYLQIQTLKYYETNTFLHRGEKVKFKDIYYPLKAKYKKLTTDFIDAEEVLLNYSYITLIGMAGSGKSTLLRYIFFKLLEGAHKIPILIELRELNDYSGDFESFLLSIISRQRLQPSSDIFKRTLDQGCYAFLLDGYDEIFSKRNQTINKEIQYFVESYPDNLFIVTTRPGSGMENTWRFFDFQMQELTPNDVLSFVDKIIENEERKHQIINVVGEKKNISYFSYLKNPLLLSMFILAFESHPEIPSKKSSFYRNVFDTLYNKHDGITKNSFKRERLTNLERDDFERILTIFSFNALIKGHYKFTEEYLTDKLFDIKKATDYKFKTEDFISDLRTAISILTLDGFEFSFPHRSMQEYFAAQFISFLPSTKKQRAYDKVKYALQNEANDSALNFWDLCLELDKYYFLNEYAIPELKYFVDQSNSNNYLERFLTLTNITFQIRRFNINYHASLEYPNYYYFNLSYSLESYIKSIAFEHSIINLFLMNISDDKVLPLAESILPAKHLNDLRELSVEPNVHYVIDVTSILEIIKGLKLIGYDTKLKEAVLIIQDIIELLNDELKKDNNQIDDILNFD